MATLVDKWSGVVVNVSDDTAARLTGSRWQQQEAPKKAAKKSKNADDE